ncbi:MAG TPA: translation initiation factor IF-3 [Candidatus Dormibacteraeota bacterium]|nr:translation initiation factor IF-3 [Candidatus Dormibacteraeota bacterium]
MRINEQIRIPQVRLFDDTTDEALGIVTIEQARQLAVDRGLDLVEVAPLAQPPVCRLMDYGRFKFEALKREKDSRRDHNVVQLKEQKLRPKISDNDFRTKLAKVKQFLGEGDKVKLTIMFRGREMVHQEFGRKLLDRMTEELSDLAIIERSPLVEGRNMIMILSPTTKKHARGDRPHDDRGHAPEHAAAGNGSASVEPPAPNVQQSPPATAPAVATEAATVASPASTARPATAAKPASGAKRAPAAAKRTTAAASRTTTSAAPERREENAEDSNA